MEIPHYRDGTDDTRWVIPELVHADMYRMGALAGALDGVGGTVLDCGAHIGVFSVLLAARGIAQPIEAFEPEPTNYELLVRNAQPFPSVRPIQAAVGLADEERQLYRGSDTGRWSLTPHEPRDGLTVRVVDLQRHIREVGRVALLKLDLEGYEADILNGMSFDVLRRIELLVTEEHHRPVDWRRLEAAGFVCWYHPLNYPAHRVSRAARGHH